MLNMLSFMRAYGGMTLAMRPFCDIDNLVYSQMSYIDYVKALNDLPCPLHRLRDRVDFGVLNKDNGSLFELARSLPRYKESVALGYVNEFSPEETRQFAAVSFLLPDGSAYVSFRGTDSTLVGWKEDFMLSFTTPVPAQTMAVKYLNEMGSVLNCPLRVGGHSKGGNLAIYAATYCYKDIQDRIINVYSNDGPGFEPVVLESEEYRRLKGRIRRFIPESSAVGILMDSDSPVTVVKSDAFAFHQHNPYTWAVQNDKFVTVPTTSLASDMISRSQKDWFRCLSEDKRRQYTDLLFDVLSAGNPRTIKDIRTDPTKLLMALKAARSLPEEDRANLTEFIRQIFSSLYAGGSAALKSRYSEIAEYIKARLKGLGDEKDD